MTLQSCIVIGRFTVATMLFSANVAFSQNYPNKPIRVVTTEIGGASDSIARTLLTHGLAEALGQLLIVDNRPSTVAGEIVAKSNADGYTLLVDGLGLWIGPYLQKRAYDPLKDLAPIALLTRQSNVLTVHPSVPVKSVKELIALAKAKPGQLNYATTAVGGSSHLGSELFKSMTGTDMVNVRYKGTGQAITALLAGEVQFMFAVGPAVAPHIKSGKLRALAVTTAQPSALFPDLPTVAASGLPGFETGNTSGMFAPIKVPAVILKRLNHEITRLLKRPDVNEKFLAAGFDVVASSPEEAAATIKSEKARLTKVIHDAGIRLE